MESSLGGSGGLLALEPLCTGVVVDEGVFADEGVVVGDDEGITGNFLKMRVVALFIGTSRGFRARTGCWSATTIVNSKNNFHG